MNSSSTNYMQYAVIGIIMITALMALLGIGYFNGCEISLMIDGDEKEIISFASTVDDLLEDDGVKVSDDALIFPDGETKLISGLSITIENPKSYTLILKDDIKKIVSYHRQVKEIIEESGIKISEMDFSNPSLNSHLADGDTIIFFEAEEVMRVENNPIPYITEVVKNERLDRGVENVLREGKEGYRRTHVKDIVVNQEVIASIITLDTTIHKPVNRVVERGTNSVISTSRGSVKFTDTMILEATAYDLSFNSTGKHPGDPWYGITASGTKARPGTVAVDPKVIPLGTKLYVQSLDNTKDYGFAVAEDVGGVIKGNKIDLFFHSSKDVWNFGRRDVKVYILD